MVRKYLDALSFSHSYINHARGLLFYLENNKTLMMSDLADTKRTNATAICTEDFSKRSFGAIELIDDLLYIYSDEENKENYNLYSLNIRTQEFKQVTFASYVGVYGFSDSKKLLVYGNRYKTENGKFSTKLILRNLKTADEEELFDDHDQEYRLSWSGVTFGLNDQSIYVIIDLHNKREKRTILHIDLLTKNSRHLLPKEHESAIIASLDHPDKRYCYYINDICGFTNIYRLDINSLAMEKLTHLKNDCNSIHRDENGHDFYIATDLNEKDQTHICKVEITGDRVKLHGFYLKGSHSFVWSDRLWLSASTMNSPSEFTHYDDETFNPIQSMANYRGTKNELIHGDCEFIHYESFDGLKIPTFILVPNKPIRGAVITAFYGGNNYYNWVNQLFVENGFIVLSPGVRGSWSFGKKWQQMILGDLGGDEIIDVHYGAKYLQERFNLLPKQIGVEGGSHGGYAVLRALTMAPDFRPQAQCRFDYGFGVCWAGFADLEEFYRSSNIPDWLVKLLGPYPENAQKYRERSPLYHTDKLEAPLFVAHGKHDVRVPFSTMKGFLDQIEKENKPHQLHLMDKLGHGAGDKEEQVVLYEKLINFVLDSTSSS